ncbi:MAG: metalloregulator ArsR/SmtB family transcription factor [Patescibacteria group bacterium]
MKELEKILKALANRRRLAILRYLKEKGSAPVGNIAKEINLSFKSTSRHLCVLAAVDIVEREQKGLEAYYSLSREQKPILRKILSVLL